MWPFKKEKSLAGLTDENQKWSVIEAENELGPILVRVNNSAIEWAKHPELNIRVGFAIPLNSPNPGGLPDAEENLLLNEIEDGLCELLKKTSSSIQVLAITTGQFKEFVFYIQNGNGIEGAHKKAISQFSTHEIQCVGENDPDWQVYDEWANP